MTDPNAPTLTPTAAPAFDPHDYPFYVPLYETYDENHLGSAFIDITAEMADMWLTRNDNNRPVHADYRDDYRGRIRRGEFRPTNQGIGIAYDGKLLDGQKRLMAISAERAARPSVKLLVVWGLDYEAQDRVDIGQSRSLATTLTMKGYRYTTDVLATARLAYTYVNNTLFTAARRRQLSPQQLTRFFEDNQKDLYVAITHANHMIGTTAKEREHGVPFTRSGAAALYFLVNRANPAMAEVFWTRLRTGEHATDRDPVWVLRNRIHREALDRARGRGLSPANAYGLVLAMKAWGLFMADQPVDRLVLDPDSRDLPPVVRDAAMSLSARYAPSSQNGHDRLGVPANVGS